jgi:hypothetical protein
MKQDLNEIGAIEVAVREVEMQVTELGEFQLALIGGGCGEVVFT